MASGPQNFDINPPMPVNEYEQTVRAVNIGYDLIFTISHAFLRSLGKPDLELLVIGAGGGAEITRFLPANPGWRLTGVDPSSDMLALAERQADRLGVADRVTLIQGTVESLPKDHHFDAATCIFVLHFLPPEARSSQLRTTVRLLQPGAPLIAVTAGRVNAEAVNGDGIGTWQQYGELMGMPGERMAAIIQELLVRQAQMPDADDYLRELRDAGVPRIVELLRLVEGGLVAWVARSGG
jgi:tRNA (cmo5U34)-methyltransferase